MTWWNPARHDDRAEHVEGVREPAVAGTFYPADPRQLPATVDDLLAGSVTSEAPAEDPPAALVVPHAGYRYSGPIAASAYRKVSGAAAARIDHAVILGPAHFVPLRGAAVPASRAFLTPLGRVEIDKAAKDAALSLPDVAEDEHPHTGEHSIEVQLPFLQRVLSGRPVLPVLVGGAAPDRIAALLEAVTQEPGVLVVVSTDLSHYLPQSAAQRHDRRTAAAIVGLNAQAIRSSDACGAVPLCGLLVWAAGRRLRAEQLDLRTSGETAGDRAAVVGYGAFALWH